MKKRLFSIFLALAMALSLMPTMAMAEGETWTEVASAEALTEALQTGGNIKLTQSFTTDQKQDWEIKVPVVLDLNGNTITSTYGANNSFLMTVNGGSLTVTDESVEKNGSIQATDPNYGYGIQLFSNSSFTLLAGTIKTTQETVDIYTITSDVSVNISGGKLVSTNDNVLGVRGNSNIAVDITGGEMVSNGRTGVYISSYAEPSPIHFTMTGGTLSHTNGRSGAIQAYMGAVLTVGGDAEISSADSYGIQVQENTVLNVEGGTVKSTSNSSAISCSEESVVNITGGTVRTNGSAAVRAEESSKVSISGGKIVGSKGLDGAKENITVTGGTFQTAEGNPVDSKALQDYLAPGATMDADGKVTTSPVATVGGVEYTTLDAAFKALSAKNHTLTLTESGETVWAENTPVYWQAGSKSDYAATLQAALTEAYKVGPADITIVCRPGADVGTMTHGHVADNLTIYGNKAWISGGECDLEVDQYKFSRETGKEDKENGQYLEKDITITAYKMDNLGVWGTRNTKYTLTVNLIDCDGIEIGDTQMSNQRVMLRGGIGTDIITLTDCNFIPIVSNCTIHSTENGSITLNNCTFTGIEAPVNINHKLGGDMTVTVNDCKFNGCGYADTTKDLGQYAAPIRVVNASNETSNVTVSVSNCTFTDTVGNNGDILLGDGRTGKDSYDVTLTVTNTAANVQAQKPGYYDASGNVTDAALVSKTTVEKSETPVTITNKEEAFYVARVGTTEYTSLPKAIQAAMAGDNKTVTLLKSVTVDSWTQIWNIKGITLEGNNKILKINAIESLENHDAVFHSAGGNTFKNLTIDLSDIGEPSKAQGSRAFSAAAGDTFTNVKIIGNENVAYGITVSGTAAGKDETITIEKCEFTNCKYGVYSDEVTNLEKLTITGSEFTGCEYATILYTENTAFTNNTVTGGKLNIMSDQQTVTGNTFKDKSCIKFYENPKEFKKNNISTTSKLVADAGVTGVDVSKNYWGGGAPSKEQINDVIVTGNDVYYKDPSMDPEDLNTYVPAPSPQPDDRPSGGSGSSSSSDGDYIVSVDTNKHGTVTVSPKRADKGDTVTITVKPDKGYELDELVVTDKNGDTVKLKDKGNGKFSFTMPGSKVTVEAKFVKESASQLPFADVSADYWAYDEIAWAYENGYMNGTSATAFNPGGNVSRQQLWMILARLSGASPASMAEAREWAIGNGISDGSNPGGAISRQQMVATLYRYAKLMGYDTTGAADLTVFPDHASVADYAKEAMAWSVKNEIVGGTAQGTLNPAGTASRAQFAVILYRFVK